MATENLRTMQTENVPATEEQRQQRPPAAKPVNWYRPPVDVFETEDGLQLVLDVPGVKPDAIEVQVEGRVLTIQGVRSHGNSGWRRSFTLPDGLDTEHVSAKAEHGVLRLDIPMTEARKPRKIEVR